MSEPAPAPTEKMPLCLHIETEISGWAESLECADSWKFVGALAAQYKELFGKDYQRRKKEMWHRLSERRKKAIRLLKPASIAPDVDARQGAPLPVGENDGVPLTGGGGVSHVGALKPDWLSPEECRRAACGSCGSLALTTWDVP